MLTLPWLASMRRSFSASVTTRWPVRVTSPLSVSYSMWSAANERSRKVMTASPSRMSTLFSWDCLFFAPMEMGVP